MIFTILTADFVFFVLRALFYIKTKDTKEGGALKKIK